MINVTFATVEKELLVAPIIAKMYAASSEKASQDIRQGWREAPGQLMPDISLQEGKLRQEKQLLSEYHALVDLELAGILTDTQANRLHEVEQSLNQCDANDPYEQIIDARMQETHQSLEKILNDLQRLPLRSINS